MKTIPSLSIASIEEAVVHSATTHQELKVSSLLKTLQRAIELKSQMRVPIVLLRHWNSSILEPRGTSLEEVSTVSSPQFCLICTKAAVSKSGNKRVPTTQVSRL